MIVQYAAVVSFFSLLIGYVATLFIGWSIAHVVPFVGDEGQRTVLVTSSAVAAVMLPVWLIHWSWAKQHWLASSELAQKYLVFFSACGLGASVIVGIQLIIRVVNLITGSSGVTWEGSHNFIIGASWSVVLSLAVAWYHGREWMSQKQTRSETGPETPPAAPQATPPSETPFPPK
jgi:hypothetical protein